MIKNYKHPYFSYSTQLIKPMTLTYVSFPHSVKSTAFFGNCMIWDLSFQTRNQTWVAAMKALNPKY